MNTATTATWLRRFGIASCLLVIVVGVGARFYGLSQRGLYGSDTVYYTSLTERWLAGDRVYSLGGRSESFRPAVFAVFELAARVLGFRDDSLKRANALVDSLNICLVFLLAYGLSNGGRMPALIAAALYSALPNAIYQARLELTHTVSAFWVLLSVVLVVGSVRTGGWRSFVFLSTCGVAAALAALSHEELLFIAPALAAVGVLAHRLPTSQPSRLLLARLAAFLLPFLALSGQLIVAAFARAQSNAARTLQGADPASQTGLPPVVDNVERAARFFWNSMVANTSLLMAGLSVFLIFCWMVLLPNRLRREDDRRVELLPIVPLVAVAVYLGLYSFFFEWLFARVFLPLTPLILCFVTVVGSRLFGHVRPWLRSSIFSVVVLLLLLNNLEHFRHRPDFSQRGYSAKWVGISMAPRADLAGSLRELRDSSYRTSWARGIYDRLESKVNDDARLLVLSSLMYPYPGRRDLQAGYYFGDNAVYLFDHDIPLNHLIEQYQIRWVLFSSFRADRRFLDRSEAPRYIGEGRWSSPRPLEFGRPLGIDPDRFSLRAEYEALLLFLDAIGAEKTIATGSFLTAQRPTLKASDEGYVVFRVPQDLGRAGSDPER